MTRSSRHGLHCITDILTSTLQGVPVFFPVGSLCSPLWFFPVWSCGLVPVGSSLWSSLCGPLLWACGCLSCGPHPVPLLWVLLWAPVACSGIDAAQGRSIPLQVAGCRFIIIRTGSTVPPSAGPAQKDTDRPPVPASAQHAQRSSPYKPLTACQATHVPPAPRNAPSGPSRPLAGHPVTAHAKRRPVWPAGRPAQRPHGGARVGRRWSPPLAFATQF